jgi:CBS domain-containing protein
MLVWNTAATGMTPIPLWKGGKHPMSVGRFAVRQVITVHPEETVEAAAQRMRDQDVGALVVVEGKRPVGIVTDRDLVTRVLAADAPAKLTTVCAVMTPRPICISESAPLEGAMANLRFYRIRRLVVVNEAQEVVGILSLDDVLELLAEEREALEAVIGVMRAARREKL